MEEVKHDEVVEVVGGNEDIIRENTVLTELFGGILKNTSFGYSNILMYALFVCKKTAKYAVVYRDIQQFKLISAGTHTAFGVNPSDWPTSGENSIKIPSNHTDWQLVSVEVINLTDFPTHPLTVSSIKNNNFYIRSLI